MSAEPQLTEEEIRAYEEQLSRVTTAEIALQACASLLNVGGRKLGFAPGAEQERDLEQVRDAVDAVRALLPVVERRMSTDQARPLRDALSQLQMAYAQLVQAAGAEAEGAGTATGAGAATGPAVATGPGAATGDGEATGGGAAGASSPPDRSASRPGGSDSVPGEGERGGGSRPSSPAGSEQQDGRAPGPAESSGRLWVPGR